MSCAYHHEPPPNGQYCKDCESGEHRVYEAARVDWVDRCPQCRGGDINFNEVGGYKWCGNCGAQSVNVREISQEPEPSKPTL